MATITYYTTPAKLEASFDATGGYDYTLKSNKVTLDYGNLTLIANGSGFSNNLTGYISSIQVLLSGKTQLSVSGLHVSLEDAYHASSPYDYVMEVALGGSDKITGSIYSDALYGWAGNDTINGLAGNDTLIGGSGSDRIAGGMGKDRLTGEAGNDIFVLTMPKESGFSTTSRDVITDFTRGQDRIDLSGIDSNTAVAGNNAFKQLLPSGAAFTSAGQLKLIGDVLCGNTDADATPEFAIQLVGISALTLGNFIL